MENQSEESLKACIEPAIDALAECIYSGNPIKLQAALEIAEETIALFPDREEPKALLTLINFFKN